MSRTFGKIFLGMLVLLSIISATPSLATTIDHVFPDVAQEGEVAEIVLQLSSLPIGERVIVSELLPEGSLIESWSVVGSVEPPSEIVFSRDGASYVWEFTPAMADVHITYVATLPDGKEAVFDAVYVASPTDFGRSLDSLSLSSPPILPPAEVVVEISSTSAVASETAAVASAISTPLLALYFVLLGALAYLLLRIRQHSPHASRKSRMTISSFSSKFFSRVNGWLVSFGKLTNHVASETINSAEHLSGDVRAPQVSHQMKSAPSLSHTTSHVKTHTPVSAPVSAPVTTPKSLLSEEAVNSLDKVASRYERVFQRIDAYEKLAKDDEAVVSLLESLKSELRSISFETKA